MNTKEKSPCQSNGRPCIFITGASSGIGRATAELFAQKGWFVGICGRNSIELKKTFTSLGKDNVISFAFDIRDRNKWDEAVEQFGHATNQRMDVLFNNAGIGTMGDFLDIPEVDAITSIDFINRCCPDESIGQSGGVRHQFAHREVVRGVFGSWVVGVAANQHLQVTQRGQVT